MAFVSDPDSIQCWLAPQRTMHRYCRIFRQNPNCRRRLTPGRHSAAGERAYCKAAGHRTFNLNGDLILRSGELVHHISLRETNKSFLWVLMPGNNGCFSEMPKDR